MMMLPLDRLTRINSLIAILCILIFCGSIPVGAEEIGTKFIRVYTRKEYKSQPQNWFTAQDKRGFIYVANQGSVLEYDGVAWKEYLLPGKTARSLAAADTGMVYIGGYNEIGKMVPGQSGRMEYRSLTHLLDKNNREFGHVWKTFFTSVGVYFCTSKFLFLLRGQQIKIWRAETSFSPPILCGDKLYVRQKKVGLSVISGDTLQPLPWGRRFAVESVYMITQTATGGLLIGVREGGFLRHENGSLSSIETPQLIAASALHFTHGIRLSRGNLALATQKGGVFIFDQEGRLNHRFHTVNGLPDNAVSHIFQDTGQNLWLATYKGIARIEYGSPFSFFHNVQGLPGLALCVTRHGRDKRLYVGGGSGVFMMNETSRFQPLDGIPGNCYRLFSAGNDLLAATDKGIFHVSGETDISGKMPNQITDIPAYVFHASKIRNLLLTGTKNGLFSLSRHPVTGAWTARKYVDQLNEEIRTIVQDNNGKLWLGSPKGGVTIVNDAIKPGIRHPDVSGCPPGIETHLFYAAGHVMVATGKGIFRWHQKKSAFVPDLTLGPKFAGGERGRSVKYIAEDGAGGIWIHSKARNLLAVPQADGTYRIYKKKFLRIPLNPVSAIYPDPYNEIVWLAGADGLIRVVARANFEHNAVFKTFIRGVHANGSPIPLGGREPVLPFQRRSLRFSFAAPFYEAEDNTLYRCRLEGYDRQWTAWSSETRKDYTNLDPGLNIFRVQAKNVYGDVSQEASFRFRLLPPWHRTRWAYSLYIVTAILLVAMLVKWRSATLRREKQQLESIVAQRTDEINRKNIQLQEMGGVKSRFFTNISHEFRTPLTLILGPLDQMIDDTGDRGLKKKYTVMRRNAQRLLNLINQLLELSKLDSGNVTLNASCRNMVSFLKGLTASFELLTIRKDQELIFRSDETKILVYFDITRMEEVFCNLMINAVKFTPPGGRIRVSVIRGQGKSPAFPEGYVQIEVADTGPGIPASQVEHIFQRFYYSEHPGQHSQKGAGIGLAIAKEWLELHHGDISVSGKEGEGSCFTVRLPLGNRHLQPYEIADVSQSHEPSTATSYTQIMEEEMEQEEGNYVTAPFTGNNEIVLVVEDSADVRHYIRSGLEPRYKVIEAENGKEGIEKALYVIPDLIVSDIMMPVIDGIQLCKTLKADRNTSHIPIILLTAKASEENMLEGLETGADDYITKPFSTKVLCARIKNLIDLRRQLQQDHRREMALNPVKTEVSSMDREFFKDLRDIIEANLEDPEFNVDQLAKKLYMSRATVYRKIEALCGESPSDYIRSFRLKRAALLLSQGTVSVTEVAFEVGFNSRTYFTKCFKEAFHQLPSDFRKNH